jgi:hypothetical protein
MPSIVRKERILLVLSALRAIFRLRNSSITPPTSPPVRQPTVA